MAPICEFAGAGGVGTDAIGHHGVLRSTRDDDATAGVTGDQVTHHTGVAFKHIGKALFSAMKILGVEDVSFNQPENKLYCDENPF